MYCRNCGKEMQGDAKFCAGCGKAVVTDGGVIRRNMQTKESSAATTKVILHYVSLVCVGIILLLLFSKWIKIDMGFFSRNVSVFEMVSNLKILSEIRPEGPFFIVPIGAFMIIVMVVSVKYLLKAFNVGHNFENEHISYGKYAMLFVIIASVLFMILLGAVGKRSDGAAGIWIDKKFIFILLLACLNRFIILPLYEKNIYRVEKEYRDNQIYSGDVWICKKCDTRNEKQLPRCKSCGEHK